MGEDLWTGLVGHKITDSGRISGNEYLGMKLLIHSQTLTVQEFNPPHYNGCNYLSMQGLKLKQFSKKGPGKNAPGWKVTFPVLW